MPVTPPDTVEAAVMPDQGLRSHGMRDLGPEEMARFRAVERTFLDVSARAGYREIRMPTIEPLHLYTSSGTLSPQALDRVYSFLDWDGWSGERVVLRPDATVAVARWYAEQPARGAQRLAYVQPVYRFAPQGDREVWQCGIELFGEGSPSGDGELVRLARDFLAACGIEDVECELAHAGLVREVFAAGAMSPAEQLEAYDRILEGDAKVTEELAAAQPDRAPALRLLAGVDGSSAGYIQNLRASLLSEVPAAASALDELEASARALDAVGVRYRVLAATARNFEYYTGVTFRFLDGAGRALLTGGRYDRLVQTLGGGAVPASGWAANLLDLAESAS
jgi:histidyl-tRNA synthetase